MEKQRDTLFLGEVLKSFGLNGELIVKLSPDAPEKINIREPVFITIDGLSVPFYFKSVENKGNHKLMVIFDDMETETTAKELIGKKIYYYSKVEKHDNKGADLSDFIGFLIIDSKQGELGEITDFFDYPGNPCFQLFFNNVEIIIPVNEDLIEGVDTNKQIILLNLPEGLMDIYL